MPNSYDGAFAFQTVDWRNVTRGKGRGTGSTTSRTEDNNRSARCFKDTQQSRIGAMVLGQDLNGVGSYEQTVFAALMNVSSRHVEPGGKVF